MTHLPRLGTMHGFVLQAKSSNPTLRYLGSLTLSPSSFITSFSERNYFVSVCDRDKGNPHTNRTVKIKINMNITNTNILKNPRLHQYKTKTANVNMSVVFSRGLSCWKCQATIPLSLSSSPESPKYNFPLKCPKCDRLQPQPKGAAGDLNFFEMFGLKGDDYKIDLPMVSFAGKRLQRQLHPDLFTQKEKIERELSQYFSSLVNKAMSTLQDPISRGHYLLQLKTGVEVDLEREQVMDAQFLGKVMELNEILEEMTTAQQWQDFRRDNKEKLLNLETELENAFHKDDLKDARLLLKKMKFYENLLSRLKLEQHKYGIVD